MPAPATMPQSDLLELTATTLSAVYGNHSMLCYGGDEHATDLRDSQQILLAVVSEWARHGLPQAASVMLRGESLEDLRRELRAAGMTLIDTAPREGFTDDTSCDLAVIEGPLLNKSQLNMLTWLRRLLKDQGRLLLFTENLADDSRVARSELANLSSLHQQAGRLGYALLRHRDFSAAATASLDLLRQLLLPRQQQLRTALGWTGEQMARTLAELDTIREEFDCGRRCFQLFEFEKLSALPGRYAEAVFGDIDSFRPAEIRGLFEASFGVEFDEELWIWKYQMGKAVGDCVVVRQREGGDIISHYGGAPREIEYFGTPAMAVQPSDVMVLPEARGQYGRESLFFKTAATFLEREIGNTVKHLLGFGFPNQKAMNTAVRLGLYQKTDDFLEVVFGGEDWPSRDYQFTGADINQVPRHRHSMNLLWQQMRSGFRRGIIGIRDADYIDYRYFQHPFAERGLLERQFILDSTGKVLGFVVLKEHQQQRLLMDIVCCREQIKSLLAAVARRSLTQYGRPMALWITRGWLETVRMEGCAVNDLGIEIPCNSWNPGPDPKVLCGAWWLTAGDMDFM